MATQLRSFQLSTRAAIPGNTPTGRERQCQLMSCGRNDQVWEQYGHRTCHLTTFHHTNVEQKPSRKTLNRATQHNLKRGALAQPCFHSCPSIPHVRHESGSVPGAAEDTTVCRDWHVICGWFLGDTVLACRLQGNTPHRRGTLQGQ